MNRPGLALVALFSLAVSLGGCASTQTAGGEHHHDHEHGEGGHKHKHKFEGGMKDFHDVLAPPYHMDKGPARDEKACGNVAGMKTSAATIATQPKGDPAAHKTKADTLAQSVTALEAACAVAGRADVSAKLETVHDGFHALMKPAQ